MTVFSIALGHGMPVALAGFLMSGWSRTPMYVTAVIMTAIAVFAGRPEYMTLDLAGVALGLYIGGKLYKALEPDSVHKSLPLSASPAPPPPPDNRPRVGEISVREAVAFADELYDLWVTRTGRASRSPEAAHMQRQVVRKQMRSMIVEGRHDAQSEAEMQAFNELTGDETRGFYLLMCNLLVARGWMNAENTQRFLRNYDAGYAQGFEEARGNCGHAPLGG